MSILHPFRALRPVPERAGQIAAVPYDVVNREEAAALGRQNPWSFLHVSRSEIDLPEVQNPYIDEVYRKAASNLDRLVRECPMIREAEPSLYLYRLQMEKHVQIGVVGCFSVDEYDSNRIKKHERTRHDKEDDRTRHILKLSVQTGPAFLVHPDIQDLESIKEQVIGSTQPLYDFVAEDGIKHTAWKLSGSAGETIAQIFEERVSTLYIADGHHRAAAASRVRKELGSRQGIPHRGDEEYNFFLAVAFPFSQLQIFPYYRIIKNLHGASPLASDVGEWIQNLKQGLNGVFSIQEGDPEFRNRAEHLGAGEFGMYLAGKWYHLRLIEKPGLQPTQQPTVLDVTILQERILGPFLGIHDPRTDPRIGFVGGIRGLSELERLVDSGEAVVAFSLRAIPLSQMIETADRGEVLPPKSTWFEPKLRDGLFSHCLD